MSIGKTTDLNVVNTDQLVDGSVTSAKIAAAAINSTHLAAASVGASQIIDASIASAELADNAVVASKINAAAVGTSKIDSTTGSSWYVLTANGSGGASFIPVAVAVTVNTTTSYTAVLADAGKMIEFNNAAAVTFTIPPNSTAAFVVGAQIDLLQTGAGQVTVAAGAGVTVNSSGSKLKLTGQWAGASIIKRATNTWVLVGNISA